ncbi:MAG: tRNA (N6-threonylcarbamoyladenosine(37)-N6)-methyltransferase TrmO [Gammaproteobacteria bacterium]|nr:tRNA (N6-threonylcarbamoyladenosine(37)-N6)-methyltransferase TrmO [Gammaproteobacteria bacterium]
MSSQKISLNPIDFVNSPYKQKFGIPRQANLVSAGVGSIELNEEHTDINCLRGIEQFSHLWVVFLFHATANRGWSATVKPPRLGGKEKVGVFSSRAPFRPNPIGISAVEYVKYQEYDRKILINIRGLDLLDGTPVLDLKPYIPYADSLPDALGGYAAEKPNDDLFVEFAKAVEKQFTLHKANYPNLKKLITQVLTLDPRPAWKIKSQDDKQYGMTLYNFNVKFRIGKNKIRVTSLLPE